MEFSKVNISKRSKTQNIHPRLKRIRSTRENFSHSLILVSKNAGTIRGKIPNSNSETKETTQLVRTFFSQDCLEMEPKVPLIEDFVEDRYSIACSIEYFSEAGSFSSIYEKCEINPEEGVIHEEQNFSSSEDYEEE